MRITIAVCLMTLFMPAVCLAQKENNIWIFGDSIGMDFNSGVPVECTSSVHYYEGCGTVSDPSGKLLFYGARNYIWDRFHDTMLNGYGILGNNLSSTTQGILILPFIGDPDKYYLFTLTPVERFNTEQMYLRYSVIDMSLNGGKGDVDASRKNVILDSFTTEKMISAIGDGCSLWLISQRWDTAEIHAFRIDASGLSSTPVISGFPSARYTKGTFGFLSGGMAISPDFRTLSTTSFPHAASIELFDFDRTTGMCSNRRQITGAGAYWNIFSPDGSKLYSSKGGWISQYDLSLLPSLAAVIASETVINKPAFTYGGMRLGPDGQIYVSGRLVSGTDFLVARIRKPDLKGAACDLEDDIGLFKSKTYEIGMNFGLPLLMPVPKDTLRTSHSISLCDVSDSTYTAPAGYRSYQWEDGVTGRSRTFTHSDTLVLMMKGDCEVIYDTLRIFLAVPDKSSFTRDTALCFIAPLLFNAEDGAIDYYWQDGDTSRSKLLTGPGRIWLRRTYPPCRIRTDTFNISALRRDTTEYALDTNACFTGTARLSGRKGYTEYLWNTGDTSASLEVNSAGIYLVTATDRLSCKIRIDTFRLDFIDFDFPLQAIDSLCGDKTIKLNAFVPGAHYLWQDGSTDSIYEARRGGIYTVKVTIGSCSRTKSVNVNQIPFAVSLGNDLTICEELDSVVLRPGIGNVDYRWQNGETGSSFVVRETGHYSVSISKGDCFAQDDIFIRFIKCDRCLAIPNAFSPNNDGINDVFKPLLSCPVTSYELSIYNRWGQEVFHATNPSTAWDGSYEGRPSSSDVFFYLLRISLQDIDKEPRLFKGDINLIR